MVAPRTADYWLEAIHREFARESDRAAGIVVAAMLDEALKDLLTKRLVPAPKKDRDLVTGQRAPLGTFSTRIDAAHQLGLISSFLARDLHLIRDIRNTFAHEPGESTFETASVKDRVAALEQASDYNRRQPDLRAKMGPPGTRGDFLGIAAWILFSLAKETEEAETIRRHGPEFGYMDWDALPSEIRSRLTAE
jgi:hypothetical protein